MAAHRKWSDEQQAEAMAIYHEHGVAEASRQTGMPMGTVSSLAHRNGNATIAMSNTRESLAHIHAKRQVKVEQIKDGFADLTLHMQERAIQEEKGTQAQAWTTSAAISADKLLLMSGEATSRHETRSDLDHQIIAEFEKQKARALGRRSTHDGTIIDPQAIEAESHTG